jgi:hypothetical protein
MRNGLMLVLLVVSAGCSRTFAPPITGRDGGVSNPIGVACGDGGTCASGLCVDSVCCASICQGDETCNAPRHAGTCTPRPPGDPCDAGAQCPNGWCFDGVCCSTDCSGICRSCALAGEVGTCHAASDNTDPRRDCSEVCSACYSGICGPADPGTDPGNSCTGGMACSSAQSCGVTDGGFCATDADCAVGSCLSNSCLQIELETFLAGAMNPEANVRMPIDFAVSGSGDDALLFQEMQVVGNGSGFNLPFESELLLALHPRAGSWRVVDLGGAIYPINFDGIPTPTLGRVVFQGRVAHVVVAQGPLDGSCNPTVAVCGARLFSVSSGGQVLSSVQVEATQSPKFAPFDVDQLVLTDGGLRALVGFGLPDGGSLATVLRVVDGGVEVLNQVVVAANTGNTYFGEVDGRLYRVEDVLLNSTGLTACDRLEFRRFDDDHLDTLYFADAGLPCSLASNGSISGLPLVRVLHTGGSDRLAIQLRCPSGQFDDNEVLLTYAPDPVWTARLVTTGVIEATAQPDPRNWSLSLYDERDSFGGLITTSVALGWGDAGAAYQALAHRSPPTSLWHVVAAPDREGLISGAFAVYTDVFSTSPRPAPIYSVRVHR